MFRQLVPAALLVVVVLSGCIGGFGGQTATPTPEPLDPAEAELPPGVSESGVTNASALVAAHNRTLRAEGFVLNGTFVRDPPNSGHQERRYHTVVGPDAERFLTGVRTVQYAPDGAGAQVTGRERTQVWGNTTTMIRRTTIDNRTISGPAERLGTSLSLTRAPQYASYLNYGEFTIERVVARDGHTFTTLVADGLSEDFGENATFEGRLIIDEGGIIHEGNITLDGGSNGQVDHAEYRVVRLGASPERPAWTTSATSD